MQFNYGKPTRENTQAQINLNLPNNNYRSKNVDSQMTLSSQNHMQPVLGSETGTEHQDEEIYEPSFITGIVEQNGAF
jgi:hypothetical protein